MLRRTLSALLALGLLAPLAWASKEEKEGKKLDKELKKITLTAAVLEGRRVVNRVMAEQLGVSRKQLVKERRETGFVYGQVFGAHEVGRLAKLKFEQVSEQMKQGQSLLELSERNNADLKQILADTRTLNKKIDRELDRVASGDEDEQADDSADAYDPLGDSLSADTAGFSPAEISQASARIHDRGFGPGGPFGTSGPGRAMGGGVGPGGSGIGGGRGRGPH